jgi:hypothetical protein
VYLKHLVFDGKIAVADPVTRTVAFYATEAEVEALVAAKRIRVIKRRKVKALHWIGPELKSHREPPAEELLGGSDIRSKARYSHKRETQQNPPNVWTLVPLGNWTRLLFLAVVADCGGIPELPRRKRTSKQSRKADI